MRARVLALVMVAGGCAGDGGAADSDGTDTGGNASTQADAQPTGPADGVDDGSGPATGTGGPGEDSAGATTSGDSATSDGSSGTGAPVDEEDVHYVGRFDLSDPMSPRASWPGSTVRLRIDGTALSIDLDGPAGVFFQVAVDGEPTSVIQTSQGPQTYEVVTGLPAGEHDIEIVRRNEGFFGVVAYGTVQPGPDTTIVPTPVATRRIELVGDSLTAGYGIECDSADQSFSGDTENAYLTYGMVAARAVGADAHVIAYSGIGVAQNYGGDTTDTMPTRYPRTHADAPDPQWDFSSWQPDVVLINLGTNDFSAAIDMTTFVDAYAAFVGDIRTANPDAVFMAVTWANWGAEHEGWVHTAMDQAGEGDATVLQFSIDPADGYGCDYHSNVVSNAKLGQQLADALGVDLGW